MSGTVCSTISTQSHSKWSIVCQWPFLLVRQRNGDRLQTWARQTAAGLLVDCSQEQWERSEVTGWCYDTDAVNASVSFQATLYIQQDSMWRYTDQGAKQCNGMFPAWHSWLCRMCRRIKNRSSHTGVFPPTSMLLTCKQLFEYYTSSYQNTKN